MGKVRRLLAFVLVLCIVASNIPVFSYADEGIKSGSVTVPTEIQSQEEESEPKESQPEEAEAEVAEPDESEPDDAVPE